MDWIALYQRELIVSVGSSRVNRIVFLSDGAAEVDVTKVVGRVPEGQGLSRRHSPAPPHRLRRPALSHDLTSDIESDVICSA
eukprot:2123670-Rhodomonas_salina.1